MSSVDEQFLSGGLPHGAVEKAVKDAKKGAGDSGVFKVIYLDDQGQSVGEWASTQIPEDPFSSEEMSGLQAPPFSLEQLVFLAETHPVHGSALDQKTADVVGKGWTWEAASDAADTARRVELSAWFEGLAPADTDMQETLNAVCNDYETVGWGLLELARDPSGKLRRVYQVPAHTVRAHKNGFALAQKRGQNVVWFRRWGAVDVAGAKVYVDSKTGATSTEKPRNEASDLFVIRKQSRRSSWYGIPGYITAIGWVTLALAARDDNIMFFQNRREPRWAIVITGLSEDSNFVEDMRRTMVVDMKQAYRNMIIPVTGQGKVDFQKLSDTAKDGSFGNLSDRADRAIMVAHRVPAERLANSIVGPLGGNNVSQNNRIYKDAVVFPTQELFNRRVRKLIAEEYSDAPQWRFKLADLDISDAEADLDMASQAFKSDLVTLREARERIGYGPLMEPLERDEETGEVETDEQGFPLAEPKESELNDKLYTMLPGVSSFDDIEEPPKAPADRGEMLDQIQQEVTAATAGTAKLLARLDEIEAMATDESALN